MSPTLFAELLAFVVSVSGYSQPSVPPAVHLVPHHQLEVMACSGQPCHVVGWTPSATDVYIDDSLDLDTVENQSIVVHELTHALQNGSGKFSAPHKCIETITTEREAYATQVAYLEDKSADFRPRVPPIWAMCPKGMDE